MPELPEVETIRRQLAPRLEGRRIVRVVIHDPRWCEPVAPAEVVAAVEGRRIEALRRRGKYFDFALSDDVHLLWHLRRLTTAHLHHPSDITSERALEIMRLSMVRDRDRHFRWLLIDAFLMICSAALVVVPGPNVIGYYFAFRVVGHYLSWRGARQGLDAVTWTTAPCDPLIDLRDALHLEPPQRDARIDELAERMRLPRLALFVNRLCWPASVEPRPAAGA